MSGAWPKAPPELLDIWKFQTHGQIPFFIWTVFLGWKRELMQKLKCFNFSRNSRQGDDTQCNEKDYLKKLAISERKLECQIPLWISQILLSTSFCLRFIPLPFTPSEQSPSVTSFLSPSLWKDFWVPRCIVHLKTPIFTSLTMFSTSPVLLAFSSTWLLNSCFSRDLWAIFTGTFLPESDVHVGL